MAPRRMDTRLCGVPPLQPIGLFIISIASTETNETFFPLSCIDLFGGGSRPLQGSQMQPFLFPPQHFVCVRTLDLWRSVGNPMLQFLEELPWLGSPAAGRGTRQLTPARTKNWLHSNPAGSFFLLARKREAELFALHSLPAALQDVFGEQNGPPPS